MKKQIASVLIDGQWMQIRNARFSTAELPLTTDVLRGENSAGLEVAYPISAISGLKYLPEIKETKLEFYPLF